MIWNAFDGLQANRENSQFYVCQLGVKGNNGIKFMEGYDSWTTLFLHHIFIEMQLIGLK